MISVLVAGRWQPADVITDNFHTLWVELGDGHCIKRHKRKHPMKKYEEVPFKMYDVEEPAKLSWLRRLWNWVRGYRWTAVGDDRVRSEHIFNEWNEV